MCSNIYITSQATTNIHEFEISILEDMQLKHGLTKQLVMPNYRISFFRLICGRDGIIVEHVSYPEDQHDVRNGFY
jgi:hypothetical protein